MSKISAVFSDLKQAGKKGLVPFITAGDPEPGLTVALMHALVRGGANVIELGRAIFRSDGGWSSDPALLRKGAESGRYLASLLRDGEGISGYR
jgi:hypothetical protein